MDTTHSGTELPDDSGQPIGEPLRASPSADAGVPVPALPAGAEFVPVEVVEDVPLLWPVFVTVCVAIGLALVAAGGSLFIAALVTGGAAPFRGQEAFAQWLDEFIATTPGLAVLILPGQISFLAVTLAAAWLSPQPAVRRIGLIRGRLPLWTWPLFLIGTPVIGMIASVLVERLVSEPSEQLKMFEQIFRDHAGGRMPLMLVLMSILPGFVEECLFRGFMQRRLLQRLPVVAAIAISALFFSLAHMDPLHAVAILPLGIWLGVVAWRAESVWPAVLGHIGNNGFAITLSALAGEQAESTLESVPVAALAICVLAFLGCVVVLVLGGTLKKES